MSQKPAKHKIETIVAGTSLSEASDGVLRCAHEVAARLGAKLIVVHGFPLPVVYGGGVYGTLAIEQQLDAEVERYRHRLQQQLERVGIAEFPEGRLELVVEMESGHRLLAQVAEQRGADLVVVGAHEAHGPMANMLGSTADRLLRTATVPVLIARGPVSDLGRVLAPVDLSELSLHSVDRGLETLAQIAEKDMRVEALFVLSNIDREGSAHFTAEQMEKFAGEALDEFLGKLSDRASVEVRPVLRHGLPRQEILDHQAEQPADLILLGTHGRSGFERFLLGSVASEVLRRLEVAALVVPPSTASA